MLDIVTLSQPSRIRNEDRIAVIQHPRGRVLALADGAGGSGGGAEAADIAVLWCHAAVERMTDLRPPEQWVDLLSAVDRQISCARGESTLVIAAISEGHVSGASVGDSAAWLIGQDQECDDLTSLQPYKPLLGSGNARAVAFERPFLSGTLLLASDGLVKYASRSMICQAALLPDLREATRSLLNCVRLKSGGIQDDTSMILCRSTAGSPNITQTARKRYTLTDTGELLEM